MSQDLKIKPMVKKTRSHQIRKLIRDIRIVQRKRGTEKQIEKNKRRATRLHRKVEALRKIDLEDICSQFGELADPPSNDAIERALSEAILLEDYPQVTSQATVTQQHSGNEFFITDKSMITLPLRANDVKHDNNDDNKKAVSQHSFKHLSLNSLFLQSLGDQDGIAPMKTKNRKGQRARQRMWELKYGREAKHLKRTTRRTSDTATTKGKSLSDADSIHPSWKASKKLKQKAHCIKQFKGTHVVFSDL